MGAQTRTKNATAGTDVAHKLTRPKVAIVGFTDTRKLAPFDDPEWEIWGMNGLFRHIPRAHRWFDLHKPEILNERHPETLKWYQERDGADSLPVFLQAARADVPNSHAFPKAEVIEHHGTEYYTSTPSWLAAYAMYLGAEEIGVWGVDMAHESEYYTQRTCLEYWLGMARGSGITVTLPASCDLLRTAASYGYHGHEFYQSLVRRRDEVGEKVTRIQQEIAKHQEQIRGLRVAEAHMNGAVENVEYMMRSWVAPGGLHRDGQATPTDHVESVNGDPVEATTIEHEPPTEAAGSESRIADVAVGGTA